jgi:hypothetical protein
LKDCDREELEQRNKEHATLQRICNPLENDCQRIANPLEQMLRNIESKPRSGALFVEKCGMFKTVRERIYIKDQNPTTGGRYEHSKRIKTCRFFLQRRKKIEL